MTNQRIGNKRSGDAGSGVRLSDRAVELMAAATARLIDASAHDSGVIIGHSGSSGAGLELADHAALSVPTGERPRPEPENPGRCSPKEPEGR